MPFGICLWLAFKGSLSWIDQVYTPPQGFQDADLPSKELKEDTADTLVQYNFVGGQKICFFDSTKYKKEFIRSAYAQIVLFDS